MRMGGRSSPDRDLAAPLIAVIMRLKRLFFQIPADGNWER
jgi:hypothetical protein